MQSRARWLVALLVVLGSVLVFSSVSAASPPAAFTANVTGLTAGGGTITVIHHGKAIIVRTVGEVTSSTLDCAGDVVCLAAGLNEATLGTTHNSLVRLTPTGPGTFDMKGMLEGDLTVTPLAAPVLAGKFHAQLSGAASCVPVGPNPCGAFAITATDNGRWQARAPGVRAGGTLSLAVTGVVGVGISGSGTISGTIHTIH